jgi:hypothetical protein
MYSRYRLYFSLAGALIAVLHICTVAAILTGQSLAFIYIFLAIFTPEI